MAFRVASCLTVLFSLTATGAFSQQAGRAPMVQPGAPGKATRKVSPSAAVARRAPADADVSFMQGMIHHHSQAVEMVALLRTRGESKALLAFGERITISQSDEIDYMKQWLQQRGKPVSMMQDHSQHM